MSSDDEAISIKNLSKCYQIYAQPADRLKQFLESKLHSILRLQNRAKYFREFLAVKDVSLTIKKGETVGIIGRNGSGKSTLLQIICGTLTPTHGEITTSGRIAALLELGSGFNPEFTGRENIYLNGAILGLTKEEVDLRFEKITGFADIGDFIDQPVKTYSSGMIVRLAFAVIAHVDADILVIDEALSVGDAVFVQKCNLFLRRFLENGTLLFVSHSMQSVLELCTRVIWLSDSEIRMDGEAKEVVKNYSAYIHQKIHSNTKIHIEQSTLEKLETRTSPQPTPSRQFAEPASNYYKTKIFAFDPNSTYWGSGGAEITDIEIISENGGRLEILPSGSQIRVRVHVKNTDDLMEPIIGFNIRNQRGVDLISENTNNSATSAPPERIPKSSIFFADFVFFMPYLPIGEYFIGGAVADRPNQTEHLQRHRRDDALRFSVLNSHVVFGIFSMPMDECKIVAPTPDIDNE
jgi:lipopolysaccharide transport system ATP-binding protein